MAPGARRRFQVLSGLAAMWGSLVAITGGFKVSLAGTPVSSSTLVGPLLLALLLLCASLFLSRSNLRQAVREDAEWWRKTISTRWGVILAAGIAFIEVMLYLQQWATPRPLWLDEQMIALNLRERSLAELAGSLWLGQSAPYGWLALQRISLTRLGESEVALRLVPLLFGLGTLATGVWIARRWMTSVGGSVLLLFLGMGAWIAFYAFELKHYSADVCWGLLLPALAVWAMEAPDRASQERRVWGWWIAAAVGMWMANGALFVAPPCALVLLGMVWRRHGWRVLTQPLAGLVVWLVSFAINYLLVLRYAGGSTFLRTYWASAFPPESAGVWETTTWLGAQLGPFAIKPGGTEWVWLFWMCAVTGWAFRYRGPGLVMASVVAMAAALAAFRVVPLFERLTLWAVPAIYVGLALAADRVFERPLPRRTARVPLVAVALAIIILGQDMVPRGFRELRRRRDANHGLNDRTGVNWMTFDHRPGDVIITTHLALPAVWWYARVPLGGSDQGARFADGTPILEAAYWPPGPRCEHRSEMSELSGRTRALVYLGFRFDDVPEGFDQLLLNELSRFGSLTAVSDFADVGRVITLSLVGGSASMPVLTPLMDESAVNLTGCVTLAPARRW